MTSEALTAYGSAPVTKYAVVYATANASGFECTDGTHTINVYDGTGTWANFYGKDIQITGYLIGYCSKKIQFLATGIEDNTDPDKPSISTDVTKLEWKADEYGASVAKTINVTLNENASGYDFVCDEGRYDTYMVVNNGNVITVYPKAANTASEVNYCLLSIRNLDNTEVYAHVALTQAAAGTSAVPDPETINLSTQGYANQQEVSSVSGDNITISFNKGSNSNTPKYYSSGTAVRVYGGGNMKVSAKNSHTISKIEITFGSGDGTNAITTDIGTYSNGTWTGSGSEVVFSVGGTSGHRRFKSIKVTFSN